MFWPQVIRGCAIMFCILPPTQLALGQLAKTAVADASGLFNLMRNLGGAIGIAVIDTVIYTRAPEHARTLVNRLTAGDLDIAGILGIPREAFGPALLDPEKLKARGLVPQDVIQSLQQQSQQVTAGQVGMPPVQGSQAFQYTLNIAGRLDDADQFENVIVKTGDKGEITRVRDVGSVELGAQTYGQVFTLNGKPAAGMAIFQSPGANALNVANVVKARMTALEKDFPQGMVATVPFDTTVFVSQSIKEVYKTLIEAGVLVLVVILLFLQDWRAMLVPATTVPVTIIGAFAAMAALGFTVNLATLFAIVLSIGIVVDDAIVVVEGAAHQMEKGLSARDAAIQAMNELFAPIIGITLVLVAVFVPASFLPGLTGRMYAQFALVIAATALLSAVNAATLKPTQSAAWLRPPVPPEQRNLFYRGFNAVYARLENAYARLIGRLVGASRLVGLVSALIIALSFYGLSRVPTGFSWYCV